MLTACRRHSAAVAFVAFVVTLTAGCGGSSRSANSKDAAADPSPRPELAGICALFEKVNSAAGSAKSESEGLTVLKSFSADVDEALGSPPESVSADARIILNAVKAALAQNSLTPLVKNTVAAAGSRLAATCHLTVPSDSKQE